MMVEKRPGIVIVGGGIGGLFTANALIARVSTCRSTSRPLPLARSGPACS